MLVALAAVASTVEAAYDASGPVYPAPAYPKAAYPESYPKSYDYIIFWTIFDEKWFDLIIWVELIEMLNELEIQAPMPFEFGYGVKDEPSYNDFSHSAKSDGKVVSGSYSVLLPDGRTQTVTYKADEYGYVADVTYTGEAKYQEYKAAAYPAYPTPAYPEAAYPEPAYPAPVYPEPAYPTPAYPEVAYPTSSYPVYPKPSYAAYAAYAAYPRSRYPTYRYPNPSYLAKLVTDAPVEEVDAPVEETESTTDSA